MVIYQLLVIPLNPNCIHVKSASQGCPLKHPSPLTFPFLRIAYPANPPLAALVQLNVNVYVSFIKFRIVAVVGRVYPSSA